jgi:hypothetical protein
VVRRAIEGAAALEVTAEVTAEVDRVTILGRVLGTQDAMPLEFWVAVEPGQYLQLDDVIEVVTELPDGREVRLYGIVDLVRARHEGAKFDSDVFLVEQGVLPAIVSQAAHVKVTRVEPEIFVPPLPGREVRRAEGARRDEALFFDGMERRLPIGLSRDGEPVFANLDFLDGSRGPRQHLGHLRRRYQDELRDLPAPQPLHLGCARGRGRQHARARLQREGRGPAVPRPGERPALGRRPRGLQEDGLARGAVRERAAAGAGTQELGERLAATGSRGEGVQSFFWTVREVTERLLRFLFAESEDASSQLSFVVDRIEARLTACAAEQATLAIPGSTSRAGASTASTRSSRRSPTARRDRSTAWPRSGRVRRRRGPSPPSSGACTRPPATWRT